MFKIVIFIAVLGIQIFSIDQSTATTKVNPKAADPETIVYLGIITDKQISISDEELSIIEPALRKKIEIDFYDYMAINIQKDSLHTFIKKVNQFAIDAKYSEFPCEDTRRNELLPVLKDCNTVDRLANAPYLYAIKIVKYEIKRIDCTSLKTKSINSRCEKDKDALDVTLNIGIMLYKNNYAASQSSKRFITEKSSLIKHRSIVHLSKSGPKQNIEPVDQHPKSFNVLAIRKAIERFTQSKRAALQLPLRYRAQESPSGDIKLRLQGHNHISKGDTFEVTDKQGKRVGFAKIQSISTNESTPTKAEWIIKKHKAESTDITLTNYSIIGWSLEASFIVVLLSNTFPYPNGVGSLLGAQVLIDYNLSKIPYLNELFIGISADFLSAGEYDSLKLTLNHFMLGLTKKWYIVTSNGTLVLNLGVRGGIVMYNFSPYANQDFTSQGGELHGGIEYVINPHLSLNLNLAGRYFYNPLGEYKNQRAVDEKGICVAVGLRIGY